MRKIQVLVVDDSAVVRQMMSNLLSGDPDIEVVGTASNGRIALELISDIMPDLVTLDVEMPEIDGLETMRAIRKSHPFLPVIMFSSLTERGAALTLEALMLGANDYITKPTGASDFSSARQIIYETLIPKIKAFCSELAGLDVEKVDIRSSGEEAVYLLKTSKTHDEPINVIAIGASTGGPDALSTLFTGFPEDLSVPILIVQHMPPIFTKLFAQRLKSTSSIRVVEAKSGDPLGPGQAFIAPGGCHMSVERENNSVKILVHQGPPENSCRPAVDVLFRSVAEIYGSRALAVVMTGMGKDGLNGSQHIRQAGGQILVQDENSSVIWGMPGFVAKAGLADKIVPLDELSAEIMRKTKRKSSSIQSNRVGRMGL